MTELDFDDGFNSPSRGNAVNYDGFSSPNANLVVPLGEPSTPQRRASDSPRLGNTINYKGFNTPFANLVVPFWEPSTPQRRASCSPGRGHAVNYDGLSTSIANLVVPFWDCTRGVETLVFYSVPAPRAARGSSLWFPRLPKRHNKVCIRATETPEF